MPRRWASHLWLALLPLVGAAGLSACDPNRVFEQNIDFPNNSWDVQQKPSFTFAIEDTTAEFERRTTVCRCASLGCDYDEVLN